MFLIFFLRNDQSDSREIFEQNFRVSFSRENKIFVRNNDLKTAYKDHFCWNMITATAARLAQSVEHGTLRC